MDRRWQSEAGLRPKKKKPKPYMKTNESKKGLEEWLKQQSTYISSVRP
jgi:hypothetical protein